MKIKWQVLVVEIDMAVRGPVLIQYKLLECGHA